MHGIEEPDELAYWRERAKQAERERDALVTRRDELLATIVKLTRDLPYPEEANAANVLIAEVGTLRAQLATVTRERDEARAGAALEAQHHHHLRKERDSLRSQLAASEQARFEAEQLAESRFAWANQVADRTAETIAAWLERRADDLDGYTEEQAETNVIAIAIRAGAWRKEGT